MSRLHACQRQVRRILAMMAWLGASALVQAQGGGAPSSPSPSVPSQSLFDVLRTQYVAKGAVDDAALHDRIRQELQDEALMARQAKAWGLDRQPFVRLQMDLASQQVLVQAWRERVLAQTPITDAELQQAYEREVARLGPDEVLVRHILVARPQQADTLIEMIEKGGDFVALAQQHTLDDTTRANGGLLDWLPTGRLIPAVKEVIDRLQPGQMWSNPVASEKGWHVLMLQSRRRWSPPPLAQFRNELQGELQRQVLQERLEKLRQQPPSR